MTHLPPPRPDGTGIPLPSRRGLFIGTAAIVGLAALPPAAARNPDARLIALCETFIRERDELDAIWSPYHSVVSPDVPQAEQDRSDDLVDRSHRLRDLITRMPTRTLAGLLARARMVERDLYFECSPEVCPIPHEETLPYYVLARDIVALQGAVA